jgi:hypothetical protein
MPPTGDSLTMKGLGLACEVHGRNVRVALFCWTGLILVRNAFILAAALIASAHVAHLLEQVVPVLTH